jgi:hypothetical protein
MTKWGRLKELSEKQEFFGLTLAETIEAHTLVSELQDLSLRSLYEKIKAQGGFPPKEKTRCDTCTTQCAGPCDGREVCG